MILPLEGAVSVRYQSSQPSRATDTTLLPTSVSVVAAESFGSQSSTLRARHSLNVSLHALAQVTTIPGLESAIRRPGYSLTTLRSKVLLFSNLAVQFFPLMCECFLEIRTVFDRQ